MKLLSYDGILAQTIRIIWRYCVLNLCFLICSLPIVTIGAATTALYAVMLPAPEDTGYVKKYFQAFASNFKQATLIWMILLVPMVIIVGSIYYTAIVSFPGSDWIRVVEIILAVLFISFLSYVFPLQARYDNSPKTTIRNAFVLCIGALMPGLLMAAVTLFPVIIFLLNVEIFVLFMAVWNFFGAALTARINSVVCMFVFAKLDPPTQKPNDVEVEKE